MFADEYLIDLNATRAYKAVYKSIKSDDVAAAAGTRLLRNVKVEDYLSQKMKAREKRTEITQDKVLKELAKIAFADSTDIAQVVEKEYQEAKYDSKGNFIENVTQKYKAVNITLTEELSDESRAAISQIKQSKDGIEVKQHDKVKALELIGKHLGMFVDRTEVDIKSLPQIVLKRSGDESE